MKHKPIDYEPLSADDVDALPKTKTVRLKEGIKEGDEWLLVRSSRPLRSLLKGLNRFGKLRAEHLWPKIDFGVVDQIPLLLLADIPSIEKDLVFDNLAARIQYLEETPVLTAAQIHDLSGLNSRNRSEPASRWKKEGKTFGIRVGKPYVYPAFQFKEGRPCEGLAEILDALPDDMTGWQTAFWFTSGNGWLNGDQPQQRLDDVSLLVKAAQQLSNLAHG